MRVYTAKYWRGSPQIKGGGYYTTRTIEARSIVSARKKAKDIAEDCIYGYMDLLEVELKEERQ